MDILIREARAEDYEDLCAIYKQLDDLHGTHHPELFQSPDGDIRAKEYIADAISDTCRALFVAVTDSKVVGFAECCILKSAQFPELRPRHWIQLDNIAVLHAYQKHHIGQMLLARVVEWAKSVEINRIELKVYAFNKAAIEFYSSSGFKDLNQSMYMDL